MSRQSRWRSMVRSNGPAIPGTRAFHIWGFVVLGIAALSAVTFVTILLLGLFDVILREGPFMMKASASTAGKWTAVASVISLGLCVCFLKRVSLGLFACIELGAAVSLTIEACQRLGPSGEMVPFAVTLFPAMYLAVTGIENMYAAWTRYAKNENATLTDHTAA